MAGCSRSDAAKVKRRRKCRCMQSPALNKQNEIAQRALPCQHWHSANQPRKSMLDMLRQLRPSKSLQHALTYLKDFLDTHTHLSQPVMKNRKRFFCSRDREWMTDHSAWMVGCCGSKPPSYLCAISGAITMRDTVHQGPIWPAKLYIGHTCSIT